MNGSDCPNCRKNLTGEEQTPNYIDDEDDESSYYNDEDDENSYHSDGDSSQEPIFDINTFLSEEDKMMQYILMEQNYIENKNISDDSDIHNIFVEFNKNNFTEFENMIKDKNYKYYKGDYKFNNELNFSQDFMISNYITGLIDKLQSPNNLLYCIRGYKSADKIYNIKSIFLFNNDLELGNNDLELCNNDFNLVECNFDEFIENIKPKEEEYLICEKYNIKKY
jgi:hypothetical protein